MTVLKRTTGRLQSIFGSPVRYSSGGPYEDLVGYSRVVVQGETGWTAGTTSIIDGVLLGEGDAYEQAGYAFQEAIKALQQAGFRQEHIVQSRMYVVDLPRNAEGVGRAHALMLGEVRPVATMVGVSGLLDPRMLVEVELVAARNAVGGGGD